MALVFSETNSISGIGIDLARRYEIVDELPEEGQLNVAYLVPSEENPDIYEVWVWISEDVGYIQTGSTAIQDKVSVYYYGG